MNCCRAVVALSVGEVQFVPHCFSTLCCMNDYLALACGGYLFNKLDNSDHLTADLFLTNQCFLRINNV